MTKLSIRERKLKEGEIIPLIYDFVFTSLFNDKKNINIVESFVSTYLNIPLEEVKNNVRMQNRNLPIENKKNKNKQVDLLVNIKDKILNIEVNTINSKGIMERNIVYASNIHGRQLNYADNKYNEIGYTIQINLNTKSNKGKEFIERNYLKNERGEILSKKIEIDIINIDKAISGCYNKREEKIARWCKVLMAKNEEELKEILGDDLMEKETKNQLVDEAKKYSLDDEVVALYSKYSREELERNTILEEAIEEGFEEGFEEGKKEGIIEIARNLKKLNTSIDIIIESTGLSIEELEKL